jgi:hypothetical protein
MKAMSYVEAIRWLANESPVKGWLVVDAAIEHTAVETVAAIFRMDVRIVATDVVREVVGPGSVTSS